MANFISNLIARHTTAASYVMPRLRGRFESQAGPAEEAMPAWPRGNGAPLADHLPAATGPLPSAPGPAAARPPAMPAAQSAEQQPAPPAHLTVAPPASLLSLLRPAEAAHPSPGDEGNEMPGRTVNNLFADHPPPANSSPGAAAAFPSQTQPATIRPLYFTIQPGPALPAYNGNGPTATSAWGNHFSPDRNMQRSGQYPIAATAPQPVIKVSIGRIDVRAITQPAAAKPGTAGKAAMSLDDFLKKRSGGTS